MGILAAIAVLDGGEQPASVIAGVQLNLGDARKLFANNVGVLLGIGAELVKINLLIKVGIVLGTLVALRIARVIKAGAVGLPRDAAAGGGEVHPRHHVGKFFPGRHLEHVSRGIFGTALGKRGGHVLAAERRHVEIDRDRSLGAGGVGVEDGAGAGGIVGRAHDDEHRLLLWRLISFGEQHSRAKLQVEIGGRTGGDQLLQAIFDGITRRQMIEIFTSARVLSGAPLLHRGIVPVFQPAIIVADFHALHIVGDRLPGCGGGLGGGGLREDEARRTGRRRARSA